MKLSKYRKYRVPGNFETITIHLTNSDFYSTVTPTNISKHSFKIFKPLRSFKLFRRNLKQIKHPFYDKRVILVYSIMYIFKKYLPFFRTSIIQQLYPLINYVPVFEDRNLRLKKV